MIITIHQPNYLPYSGFFDKMKKADLFVIYDDAQFNKEDFQHRNRIRIYNGWKWLTVPVEKRHLPIKDIMINNKTTYKSINWSNYHLNEIKTNYNKAQFYKTYLQDIEAIYRSEHKMLLDLNMELIRFLKNALGINTRIVFSSELGLKSKATEKLVEIVELLGGETYLSGPSGRNYLDINLFEKKGIKVVFQDFIHPVYTQCYSGFIPNMTVLDSLFNTSKLI